MKPKYQLLTEHYNNPNSLNIDISAENNINIIDNTINSLILKLKKFEQSQKFLRQDISLTYLASSLNNNTRYLSEVIKKHKVKNFNNYINGLRIHYITEMLYKNPQYREYKISYLAEACGFASREVFGVIFKKETGMTPSYFISKLKRENDENLL